jgi:hypothetical protein
MLKENPSVDGTLVLAKTSAPVHLGMIVKWVRSLVSLSWLAGCWVAAMHLPVAPAMGDTYADVTNLQAGARGALYVGNRAPLQPSALVRLPVGSIQPLGWLLTMLQTQRNGLNGLQEQISPFLKFATSDWTTTNGSGITQGWERVPYWLRGYIDMGYCLQDQTVISNANRWIQGVMLSQRTNGYFGPAADYGDASTVSDLGVNAPDLWPAMPMLDALRSYYEYTGDPSAMTLMRNYALWENRQAATNFGAGYWPMMRMGDNIESLYWLYNRLGEPWLLTLATNMYVNMARWDTPGSLPNWHNVNIAECFRAPAVFWQQSSNLTQLQFAESNYDLIKQEYGQVPGGAFGGDEVCRNGYYGPQQAFETCGWVELMRSFEILARITGSPVWAERCEDAAANSYPAALTTNLMELHYLTAPNQPELDNEAKAPDINNTGSPWFSYSPSEPNFYCCEHNHGMGWPYFCEETWLATWDNGLCAALYAPTTVHARVGDGSTIGITETTGYPFSETVQLGIATTNSVEFPLYLRVPQWCSNSWIQVNGQAVATNSRPTSYFCIQRTWSNGDQVILHFPRQIAVHTWAANNNCVSVNYGPLTFSLQISEDWQSYGGNAAPWTETEVYPASPWNYGLEINATNPAASFTIITNAGPMAAYPFSLATTPIQLQAKARKIPAWTLDGDYAIGPVQPSPIYSTQAEETVALVPMGAARLRVSALPTVTTNLAAATWWSAPYAPSASWTNATDTVLAMNDALEPASSSDTTIPRMTWWNHLGTTEWVRATFNGLSQISQVSVYWYDDTGVGQCRVPQSWYVQYLAGTNWISVSGAGNYGVAANQFNTVQFSPVQTTSVRLMVQLRSGFSGGILEWKTPAEPVTGLAVRYPLDSNLTEVVSGQTGVLNGGTFVADRLGVAGKALQFNGTNNYALIPRPNWMDWTMAYWVKTSDTGGTSQWYAGKGLVDGEVTGVVDDFGTSLVGNKAAFGVGNPDTTIISTTAINDGQWHHIAAARSAASGLMQLYVDGILQASTNGPFGPKSSPPYLRMGSIQTGVSGGFLAGTLDDVQIFGRVLSASEIGVVMNQSLAMRSVANTNLTVGQTWAMSNAVADPYAPPQTLTWSLGQAPPGATLNAATGGVAWRPAAAQAGSTNLFIVQVADNGVPSLSAAESFYAIVGPVVKPQLSVVSQVNLGPQMLIKGASGPDYIIQISTNLNNPGGWLSEFTNRTLSLPFYWTDVTASNSPARFYRVLLSP